MDDIQGFKKYLVEREKGVSTQNNYVRSVRDMTLEKGYTLSREWLAQYRERMKETYGTATVNNRIAAINQYLKYRGMDWRMQYVRVQKNSYIEEDREFCREEYDRLLEACRSDERLYLAIETLCSTGMRIGELKYIQAGDLRNGSVTVLFKGKVRKIFLPDLLVERLTEYCRKRNIRQGPVFVTKTGRPLDRSNLWRSMKRAGEKAGLEKTKVYPHNLRHLFAAVFYNQEKDILKLADILGHSNIETTRRYVAASGKEHRKKINELNLVKKKKGMSVTKKVKKGIFCKFFVDKL